MPDTGMRPTPAPVRSLRSVDQDRGAASRGLGAAEAGKYHRKEADPAARAEQHQLGRIVHRVVQLRLVPAGGRAGDLATALEVGDGAPGMPDDELADPLLAPAGRAEQFGMLAAEHDRARRL